MVTLDFEGEEFKVGPWNAWLWDYSKPPSSHNNPIYNDPAHTSHGRVVTSSFGVGISAKNFSDNGPDLAVLFDTRRTHTRDPDLEDPFAGAYGSGSNGISAGPQRPGHVLIVQENEYPAPDCVGGVCKFPDDEYQGGKITFDFDQYAGGVDLWEIDIFDIDHEKKDHYGHVIRHEENVMLTASYTDGTPSQTVQIGGNDIGNRKAATLDLTTLFMKSNQVGSLKVKFSSSGALDRLKFKHAMNGGGGQVPEPASFALLLTGLVGLGWAGRRRKQS